MKKYKLHLIILYIFNIIDYLFTTYWVHKFGTEIELNPVGQWLYNNNITWLFKIVIVGIALLIVGRRLDKSKNFSWIVYILLIPYSIIVLSEILTLLYLATM